MGCHTKKMILLFQSAHNLNIGISIITIATSRGAIRIVAAAITLAACVSTLVLLASEPLSQLLGKRGLHALQRLMGMLLTAVAVQMFLTGVEQFLGRL